MKQDKPKVKQSCQTCKWNGKDDYYGTQEFPDFEHCNKCVMTLSGWEPKEKQDADKL